MESDLWDRPLTSGANVLSINQSIVRFIRCHSNGHCSWRRTISSWKNVGFEFSFEHGYWRRIVWCCVEDCSRSCVQRWKRHDPNCACFWEWKRLIGQSWCTGFGEFLWWSACRSGMLECRHSDNGTQAARSHTELMLLLVANAGLSGSVPRDRIFAHQLLTELPSFVPFEVSEVVCSVEHAGEHSPCRVC